MSATTGGTPNPGHECQFCHTDVETRADGLLYQHRDPTTKALCRGGGRPPFRHGPQLNPPSLDWARRVAAEYAANPTPGRAHNAAQQLQSVLEQLDQARAELAKCLRAVRADGPAARPGRKRASAGGTPTPAAPEAPESPTGAPAARE